MELTLLAAAFVTGFVVVAVLKDLRRRRRLRHQHPSGLKRGDRPTRVTLTVEGIVYDLTEYGIKSEQPQCTVWTYVVPVAATRLGRSGRINVIGLPPFTEVATILGREDDEEQ